MYQESLLCCSIIRRNKGEYQFQNPWESFTVMHSCLHNRCPMSQRYYANCITLGVALLLLTPVRPQMTNPLALYVLHLTPVTSFTTRRPFSLSATNTISQITSRFPSSLPFLCVTSLSTNFTFPATDIFQIPSSSIPCISSSFFLFDSIFSLPSVSHRWLP